MKLMAVEESDLMMAWSGGRAEDLRAGKEVEATDLMIDWKRSERRRPGEDKGSTQNCEFLPLDRWWCYSV